MKILFGIQGTGNGHISRARVLAKYLATHDIDVTYLFSGRAKAKLFDMQAFGNFLHRDGLTFITQNGKIDYLATVKNNSLWRFYRDIRSLDTSQYDLLITDFEPVTAWAGKLQNKPVLGIGHQYAFGQHTPLAGESFMAKWIMRNFAPATTAIGLHWSRYNDNVLPPIVDTQLTAKPSKGHILVYLPFENQTLVTQTLAQIPHSHFIQYSPELTNTEIANVSLRQTCHQAFKEDLRSAKAVICNSGFELISECLHLGLPVLTKPLHGQMEQHSNALALQQLNYATVIEEISSDNIAHWLNQSLITRARPLPNVAQHIAQWIADQQWQQHQQLGKSLWENTDTNNDNIS